MMAGSLFIGLVTHSASRFRLEAERQVADLARAAEGLDWQTTTLVSDRDEFEPEMLAGHARALSVRYQVDLEYRWRRYLALAGTSALRDRAIYLGMRVRRQFSTDDAVLKRLLNIDLSHLRILAAAARSGADWALCLEDDASAQSPQQAMRQVLEVAGAADGLGAEYAVISESIATKALGIGALLRPVKRFDSLDLFQAALPVTNTVCATIYRPAFAGRLAALIRERGLVPVAPIDWRVNEALMAMVRSGEAGPQTCLVVRPGIFVQRSMHG